MLPVHEIMKLTQKLTDNGITDTAAWIHGKSDEELREYLQKGHCGYSVIVSNADVLINEPFDTEGYEWVYSINNTFEVYHLKSNGMQKNKRMKELYDVDVEGPVSILGYKGKPLNKAQAEWLVKAFKDNRPLQKYIDDGENILYNS